MPLIQGSSRPAVSENIRRERAAGKSQRQSIAIALSVARRAKHANGGPVAEPVTVRTPTERSSFDDLRSIAQPPADAACGKGGFAQGFAAGGAPNMATPPWFVRNEARSMGHTGPLLSPIGGRTDHIPLNVPAGGYVLPADVVSGLGQGNTLNGTRVLQHMFSSGPYGTAVPRMGGARGMPKPPKAPKFADGGATPPVPIMAAGGEYVVEPDHVAALGGGDMDRGHAILDAFVKHVRDRTIKTMRNLPGPERD